MGKWLRRLLLWGLLVLVAIFVVSRMLNREEDFDDYDDIDMGLDFTETPVEIDVPAESAPTSMDSSMSAQAGMTMEGRMEGGAGSSGGSTASTMSAPSAESTSSMGSAGTAEHTLIDIVGVGPTYAARLQDADINSLSDLASADAGSLADKVEVIGGRATIEDWIKQAQEMTSSGASGK